LVVAIINLFEEIVNGKELTRCKIVGIKARNELYSESISKNNIMYEKYPEYLNEIVVALTIKLADKHMTELMTMYYTHLCTFKEDTVMDQTTYDDRNFLIERLDNGLVNMTNAQNEEITQLLRMFKLESKEVFSKSQLAVNELRNKLSQLRTRESGEIIQMITKLTCYILEIQQQQGYIEISDIGNY